MTAPRPLSKQTWALGLLAMLMVSHMLFLVFSSKHCYELIAANPILAKEQCDNPSETFQEAAETYIALLLALMAPIGLK